TAAQRTVERVRATGVIGALAENSSPARRLRAVADPASLIVRLELEVDRLTMAGDPDWLRRSRTIVQSDEITLRGPGAGSLRQICVRSIRGRGDSLARISDLLRRQHGLAPGAPHPREWAEMRRKWMHGVAAGNPMLESNRLYRVPGTVSPSDEFLNADLGLLSFQERVLALAEDPRTPLRERLRFLSIVSANLDEFFTVRPAGLGGAALELTEVEG